MNKDYIYIDGSIEVTNEFGDKRKIEYSDNLEEILVKENLIEKMELELKNITYEKKHNKNISFKLLTKSLCTLLNIPLILIILPLIFGVINLNMIPLSVSLSVILIPAYLGFFLIYEYNKINKTNKGYENQISFLEEQIRLEYEKLNGLKKSKTSKQVDEIPVSKRVNDIKELKRLKELLIVYYNCGYYDYRYRKYLKQGKLRKRLSKVYSDEQIDLTLNYLEGKQKVLKN